MKWNFSKEEWIFLVFTAGINFFNWSVASLQAPFFPAESEAHQLSASEYGIIISLFDTSVAIFSPIWSLYLTEKNVLMLYKLAPFIVGVSCTLFGLVNLINYKLLYILISSALRILEGLGKSLFFVCYFKLTSIHFKEVDDILSVMQGFTGAGCIAGPLFGGILFDIWGFKGPFLSIGVFMIIMAISAAFVVEPLTQYHDDKSNVDKCTVLEFFSSSIVWVSMYAIFLQGTMWGFLFVGMEPHLRPFKLTGTEIGLVFMISSGSYTLISPFWGSICQFMGYNLALILSALLAFLGLAMIGPEPLFPASVKGLPIIAGGMALFGCSTSGLMTVPMLLAIKETGDSAKVAGISLSVLSMGYIAGSGGGGLLIDYFGFIYSLRLFIVLTLFLIIFVALFTCKQFCAPLAGKIT